MNSKKIERPIQKRGLTHQILPKTEKRQENALQFETGIFLQREMASNSPLSTKNILQLQRLIGNYQVSKLLAKQIQRVFVKSPSTEGYNDLFWISQGQDPTTQATIEINDIVKGEVHRYVEGVVISSFTKAQDMLQPALRAINLARTNPGTYENVILQNIANAARVRGCQVEEDANFVLDKVEDILTNIFSFLSGCDVRPITREVGDEDADTIAFCSPGTNLINLRSLFYTYHTTDQARALTLIHEASHGCDENIKHSDTWYNNAYVWQNIVQILENFIQTEPTLQQNDD